MPPRKPVGEISLYVSCILTHLPCLMFALVEPVLQRRHHRHSRRPLRKHRE